MMLRTQLILETPTLRRARQRASQLGVSLSEYMGRLLARDLAVRPSKVDVTCVFDLGTSGGSDIANHKDSIIANAFQSGRSSW